MRQAVFVERRRDGWARLERLLDVVDRRGLRALAAEEIEELGRLYRWVTSDLAFSEGRMFDPSLRAYLHRLTARAHGYVYGGSVEGGWDRVVRFLTRDFPGEARRSRWYILTCAAMFVLAAVVAYALIMAKPTNAYVILGPDQVQPIHKQIHDTNFGFDRDYASTMSAYIMTNNVKVSIIAAFGGITLGLLTLYAILQNGLMVGGLGAMYAQAGFGYDFWATIAPHGVLELTSIQFAGGAGLMLAAAIFNPGRLRRVDALARNARRAGTLFLGVCCMLLCAGLIEGFFSPQRFAPELRLGVGAITGLLLIYYFGFVGKDTKKPD
jgi:uncharacterized membrane protein SpoIIM required for sporulation